MYGEGEEIVLKVVYTHAIDVLGTPVIALNTGGEARFTLGGRNQVSHDGSFGVDRFGLVMLDHCSGCRVSSCRGLIECMPLVLCGSVSARSEARDAFDFWRSAEFARASLLKKSKRAFPNEYLGQIPVTCKDLSTCPVGVVAWKSCLRHSSKRCNVFVTL